MGRFVLAWLLVMTLAVPLPGFAEDSPEYVEYENIVVTPFSDPRDEPVPDWRALYLAKIERYENYLKKYQNSPLVVEVKLRIAEIYRDIEKEAVYPFRLELFNCWEKHSAESGGTLDEREECTRQFYRNIDKFRDPVYKRKAVDLLLELVGKYGHVKRYNMEEPHIGGFKWVEEEIGAKALYLLSKGTDPANKKRILLLILRDYKAGPKLLSEIQEDLKRLENVKVK